ncbi:MAG: T9SS type A sorting domain-containing protein [Bacteroidales bacterium]|nr:T9SS type A sorting domain-containing protein [Bacteroidales bacterium]
MKKFYVSLLGLIAASTLLVFVLIPNESKAQIWEPEGINIPGGWNTWTNPPVNNLALASYTQVPGGRVTKINSGTPRWQTIIKVAATGGDVIGGSFPFLFTSGPSGSPWQNTWKDVTVVMNTLQNYTYNGAVDNQATVVNGKWYTINWQDNGYASTKGIFMETSGDPVSLNTVTQSPLAGQVLPGQSVTVTLTLSATPCAEELFYLRYTLNGFPTNYLVPFTVTGTTATAVIPPITGTITYSVFSTTVASPATDLDLYTIKFNTNNGANYSYTCNITNTNVTFRVDMSNQTVSSNGVHLAGDFQGWDPAATAMTNAGGGIYTVTVPISSGTYHQYKFINGDTFAGEELVPDACGDDNGSGGFNRALTVPVADTLLGAICFSSCNLCSEMVPVTFKVDMSNQTVSADGIHIAGDFQGWNTTTTPMSLLSGGTYSATVYLDKGSYHEYKFINGNSWAGEEIVPSECGADNGSGGFNRFLNVPLNDTILGSICFSTCGPCVPMVQVTFQVDMSQQQVSADGIHLVGDFQGWNPATTAMLETSPGVYATTVSLENSSTHQYKFVNGNSWAGEESVPSICGVDNGSGGFNRSVTLGISNATIPLVCFSSCQVCLPPPATINVTFRVNLSQQVVAAEGVHLVGDFQGWDTDSTMMTHTGNGIYSVILALEEGTEHQYKFLNGNTYDGEEIVPAECGVDNETGGFNRFVALGTSDTILEAVCFSACGPCPIPGDSSIVTFRVDMQDQIVSTDGVHIAGNFQLWNTENTPMVNLSGGVYEVSLMLEEGYQAEYKFINGLTWEGAELVPAECGVDDGNGGFNRFVEVPVNDTITSDVCFGECFICHVGLPETGTNSLLGIPYPNPASNMLIQPYHFIHTASVQVRIFNSIGTEVLRPLTAQFEAGQSELRIDLSSLKSGMYTIQHSITESGKQSVYRNSVIVR